MGLRLPGDSGEPLSPSPNIVSLPPQIFISCEEKKRKRRSFLVCLGGLAGDEMHFFLEIFSSVSFSRDVNAVDGSALLRKFWLIRSNVENFVLPF